MGAYPRRPSVDRSGRSRLSGCRGLVHNLAVSDYCPAQIPQTLLAPRFQLLTPLFTRRPRRYRPETVIAPNTALILT
jgi:hypothetical protein